MQLLIIKLTSPDATPLFAGLTSKKAESSFVPCEWEDIRKYQRGSKVVLLIPDSDVSLAETKIPSKNKKQMLQAIPFALEDTLAEDIDDLHFSAYRENDDANVKVAVINRDRLSFWIDLLKEKDITVHYILPSLFGLTIAETGWSVDIGEEEAQVRQGPHNGFASSLDVLDFLLPQAIEEHEPEALYVSGDSLRVTRILQNQDIDIRSIAAVLIPLLLIWLLILQPMLNERAALSDQIKDRTEILAKVRLQNNQIKMLQTSGKRNTQVSRGNHQQKVESALRTWRLRPNLGVMSAPNTRTVKLNLRDAEADNIMRFLFDVETKYGFAVKEASLKPTKDIGKANASLTLEAQ